MSGAPQGGLVIPDAKPVSAKVSAAALANLAAARLIVRIKTPYFRPMLYSLIPQEVPGLLEALGGGIAVSAGAVMVYDPEYIAALKVEQVAGALVHEVLHLWNDHPHRMVSETKGDPGGVNRAMDRAINPAVLQAGFELPDGVCFPKDVGMKDGLAAEEYYRSQKGKPPPPKKGVGGGHCGGCAGNPLPGDADAQAAPPRSPAQMERLRRQTSEAVKDAAEKPGGNVPGDWARTANADLEPPTIPWQQELAYVSRAAVQFRAGASVHRYDMPSRKQAAVGYGDGKPVLPRFRSPIPNVAIVVDTSGSMGAAEVTEACQESAGIMKAVGAAVDFFAVDTQIHSHEMVHNVDQMKKLLKGGGGTCFMPAFNGLLAAKPRPDIVVFITDGFNFDALPSTPPGGLEVIWLLVGRHVQVPAPWGKAIRTEKDK